MASFSRVSTRAFSESPLQQRSGLAFLRFQFLGLRIEVLGLLQQPLNLFCFVSDLVLLLLDLRRNVGRQVVGAFVSRCRLVVRWGVSSA